tara:strand:+ start:120 stop:353 length:234 start_codon:yes stop_codon:yes gene_type:complete
MRTVRDGARYKPSRRRLRIPSNINNVKEPVSANEPVSDFVGTGRYPMKQKRPGASRGAEAGYMRESRAVSNHFVTFF